MWMGFGFRVKRRDSSAVRQANRYEGTACPPGQSVVRREREQRSPKFIGDKHYTDVVYCKPVTTSAPSAPARQPPIQVQTTVSPVLQTDISPQVSPVFSQMQDSPGAQQAATTTQYKPGGQEAKGGGTNGSSDAVLQFLREQQRLDAERRAQESAARDQERRERQSAEQRRFEEDRQERERRDAESRALQEEYRQALVESQRVTEPQTVVTAAPAILPSREMIPIPETLTTSAPLVADEGPNWPLILGIGALAVIGGVAMTRGKKR